MNLVDRITQRAQRTPYFHLAGYMNRWWLVPYAEDWRAVKGSTVDFHGMRIRIQGSEGQDVSVDYGVRMSWRRPVAKLLQHFGIAVRVHEILRSDYERHPHDHPWWYVTIILRGRYIETIYNDAGRLVDVNYWGPGSILFRPAGSWHRLDLYGPPVWTLFITGRYKQTWGFNVGGRKVAHREYLG